MICINAIRITSNGDVPIDEDVADIQKAAEELGRCAEHSVSDMIPLTELELINFSRRQQTVGTSCFRTGPISGKAGLNLRSQVAT